MDNGTITIELTRTQYETMREAISNEAEYVNSDYYDDGELMQSGGEQATDWKGNINDLNNLLQ